MQSLLCVILLLASSFADPIPVAPPLYQGQLVDALQAQPQQIHLQPQAQLQHAQVQYQPQQFRQLTQEEFLAAIAQQQSPQVHESQVDTQPQQFHQQPRQFINTQPLLSAADRQIQKAAHHLAGPLYAAQIQGLQLQERQAQAQAQVQRNALRLASAPRAQSSLQYQRALDQSAAAVKPPRAQEEHYDSNPSYQFGFDVKDDLYTNYQNRKEQRDGDKITGSYSVVDSDGYIRTVTYTADPKEGFKADVQRKPTDIVVKVPTPQSPAGQQPQPQPQAHPQPQQLQYRQPQYLEVAASAPSPQGQTGKQRYVYQFQ